METFIWVVVIVLFIFSLVGVFVPIIPAVVALWIGFLLYHFFIDSEQLTLFFWIAMVLFTITLIGSDLLTNKYFVNKFGGSKTGEWGAIAGVVIGAFIYPPFGFIIIPFIVVFVIEMMNKKTPKEASLAAFGALVGFLSGVVAKLLIQLIMIGWFFVVVFV